MDRLARYAQAQARAEMAKIAYAPNAVSNLERLYRFLADKNPDAALRAIRTV